MKSFPIDVLKLVGEAACQPRVAHLVQGVDEIFRADDPKNIEGAQRIDGYQSLTALGLIDGFGRLRRSGHVRRARGWVERGHELKSDRSLAKLSTRRCVPVSLRATGSTSQG